MTDSPRDRRPHHELLMRSAGLLVEDDRLRLKIGQKTIDPTFPPDARLFETAEGDTEIGTE